MDDKKNQSVKKMADLLRQGATMLADACPQCGSPLLRVGDDLYCAYCDRRIVIVSSDQEAESHAIKAVIPELRETLIRKLKSLNKLVDKEDNTEVLTKLANLMVLLLQALQNIENMGE